ncbi:hypothetical protein J6590_056574 [Homalodisca vitripennis]|nr:hypothetical protein J6590_056574 [Homalodisca vitripennis]
MDVNLGSSSIRDILQGEESLGSSDEESDFPVEEIPDNISLADIVSESSESESSDSESSLSDSSVPLIQRILRQRNWVRVFPPEPNKNIEAKFRVGSGELQYYLLRNRPSYVSRAEDRRRCIAQMQYLRELRDHSKRRLLSLTEPQTAPLPPPDVKRVFSQQTMRRQTERKYRQLTEVRERQQDTKRKESYRTNRLMAEIFKKKLQKRVLKGEVNLSNSEHIQSLVSKSLKDLDILRSLACGRLGVHPQLLTKASSYSAELYAIKKAVEIANEQNYDNIVVCSDSKAAILAIKAASSTDYEENLASAITICMMRGNKYFTSQWVPSHVGIGPNEHVDRLAKEATQAGEEPTDFKVSLEDFVGAIKQSLLAPDSPSPWYNN